MGLVDRFALIDGSKFPCRRKLVQSSCEMGTILIPISKCFKLRGLEVMMHTCIHCLCWRAKASTHHKPPKATSVRLFQISSVDNSPEHFFGANSSELSPSPLCSACLWIFSRTHVAEALVASDIFTPHDVQICFQTMLHCNRDGVEPDTHNFPDFCMAQICLGAKHAETHQLH